MGHHHVVGGGGSGLEWLSHWEDLSLAAGAPSAAASARSLRQAVEGVHWDVLVWSLKASRFQAVEAVKRAAMRR